MDILQGFFKSLEALYFVIAKSFLNDPFNCEAVSTPFSFAISIKLTSKTVSSASPSSRSTRTHPSHSFGKSVIHHHKL